MDELLYLNLLEEIEEAEIDVEDLQIIERHVGDPFTQLSNSMLAQIFRLSKELCQFLINSLEPYMRHAMRPTDLDHSLKVLVALRFFATGSYQMDVGSNYFLNVSQASVSRSIREVSEALNHPDIFKSWVKFPNNFEELNAVRRRFFEEHNIPGVVGCIDCTHVAIFPPKIDDPEYPEYVYVNRKGYHSINVQLVCDSALKIMNVSARYPGSTNDAFVWNNSNLQILLRRLHMAGYKDYYLLGDSGYPLRTWLFTPLEEEPVPNSPDYRYNTAHKRTRCIIERCNGVLKMRFRCLLKHRVLHYAPQRACKIINGCIVLHNLCIENGMPEVEEDNDEFDFGILPNIQNDNLNDHIQRINPELAEGRRRRSRLIQNVFN